MRMGFEVGDLVVTKDVEEIVYQNPYYVDKGRSPEVDDPVSFYWSRRQVGLILETRAPDVGDSNYLIQVLVGTNRGWTYVRLVDRV